jgi:hypothetical protein
VGTVENVFTFDAPVVSFFSAENSAASANSNVSIFGMNFGPSDVSGTAAIASKLCTKTTWYSLTNVRCLVAAHSGASLATYVTVGAIVGTKVGAFSYDAPVLSYLNTYNGPLSGSQTMSVFGTNFGVSDPTASTMMGTTLCGTSVDF